MRRFIYAISYLAAAVAGIGLLIFNHQAVEETQPVLRWIVIVFGIFFIIPGLFMIFSTILASRKQAKTGEYRLWLPVTIGLITLVWGVLMLCMPGGFLGRLNITFGGSLIIASFAQTTWLARGRKKYLVPVLLYVAPVISCSLGMWMMLLSKDYQNPGSEQIFASIISGIGFIIWSVNGFMSLTQDKKDNKKTWESRKPEVESTSAGLERLQIDGQKEDKPKEEVRMITDGNKNEGDSEENPAEDLSKTEETK